MIRFKALIFAGGLTLALLAAACQDNPEAPDRTPDAPPLSLLALGDSYTVGQAVPPRWSWPRQLADSLAVGGDTLQTVDVIAQTGWTSRDLLDAVRAERDAGGLADRPYGLVTVMIGVNNQFQGLALAEFEADMDTLIELALELAGGRTEGVVGFSIPDYGVTPVGCLFDPERIAREIAQFNSILDRCFAEGGITTLDITACSQAAADDPTLVARDGLHFSAEMYRRWVGLMLPVLRQSLALDRR